MIKGNVYNKEQKVVFLNAKVTKLVNALEAIGYKHNRLDYLMEDVKSQVENEFYGNGISILNNHDFEVILDAKNQKFILSTAFSNLEITDQWMMDAGMLKGLVNRVNGGTTC